MPNPLKQNRRNNSISMDCDKLLDTVISATSNTASVIRDLVWGQDDVEGTAKWRKAGSEAHHTAKVLDEAAQQVVVETLSGRFADFVLISEELPQNVKIYGKDEADLCFIADPLDGSAFARHRIPLASSSLCAYSRAESRPIASAVTDVYLGVTYFTAQNLDHAYLLRDGKKSPLVTSSCIALADASMAVLATYGDRFDALSEQTRLTKTIQWMLGNCGAIEICRVAAGDLDVAVEFAKGFRIWDVVAAAHILEKSGGKLRTPTGHKILLQTDEKNLPVRADERVKFIAANTEELFRQARDLIEWSAK